MPSWDAFEQGLLDTVPAYNVKDLNVIKTLGKGGFGIVELVSYVEAHSGTTLEAAYKRLKKSEDEDNEGSEKELEDSEASEKELEEEVMALLSLNTDHTTKCLGKRFVDTWVVNHV
jgi:hypothetical protein